MPDHNKLTAAETTALAKAVKDSVTAAIAGAANPMSTTIGDAVRRTVHQAYLDVGIARSIIDHLPSTSLGLPNISAGAAPLNDLTAAARIGDTARSAMEAFHRIAGPPLGDEARNGGFASIVSAGAAPNGLTAALGIEQRARSAADTFSRLTNLHNVTTRNYGFAAPALSAVDHVAQMRSAMHPTSLGADLMADARAAFQAALPTMPTMPNWSERITGTQSAIYPPVSALPVTGASSSLAGAFTGHASGLALSALAGRAGHISPFAELVRTSQRTIREAMGLSSPFPHTTAWMHDLFRDSTNAIAEMMRSLWPLADGGLHAAQLALRAALRVVRLLERNAPQAPAAVRDFLVDWLGFPKAGMDLVASATLVLMKVSSWLPDNAFTLDYDPRPKLRRLTIAEHRAVNRLSIDPKRKFRRAQLLSLDEPVLSVSDEDGAPVARVDRIADPSALDPADVIANAEFTDPRFLRLWCKLTDTERAILLEKGQPGVTWLSAAVGCGQPPSAGESLRRKARRFAAGEEAPETADSQAG